ncbi:MAG: proteasome accessory factor PafA2 [Verrucomicrobiales bacterium]|jgi:proteasome accessory factor PafA2
MDHQVLFGLETEYGITRDDPTNLDVVAESIALVRAAQDDGVQMKWDYSCEDPHLDARGFRVDELRQDTDEANYYAQDRDRPMSYTEIKSDLVLKNGARWYNDHAHPEYCTPECSTLLEILQQDFIGDQLAMTCAEAVSAADTEVNRVRIYKNNTDFQGHSYGCHENYLVRRSLPWADLSAATVAFLTTRQIFCGAGKYGVEDEDRFVGPGFQISQRGDFFRVIESVDTMQKRPIVNTRDEPHADPAKWRRFHVICGDANLSPFATYLKVGTTAAVLEALSRGAPLDRVPTLAEPVKTIRDLSRDRSWKWECRTSRGAPTTAIEVQRAYLELAREFGESTPERQQLLTEWARVLDDLERDPISTANRLDWSAKFELIEKFRKNEGIGEDDPWVRSLDLSYHLLDRNEGLFFALLDQGSLRLPFDYESLTRTAVAAPQTTRAALRGILIERFGDDIDAAQWDHVKLRNGAKKLDIDLRSLFDPDKVAKAVEIVRQSQSVAELSALADFVRA